VVNGVDIVQISRIQKALEKNREGFLKRIFTEKEIEYIKKRRYNPKTIAGLFAAKEAISKALGTGIGEVGWKDMEVGHTDKGKPIVILSEKIQPLLKELSIGRMDLSISHDGDYAIAFVIGY